MIIVEKSSLENAYIEHIGVKGMHWGIRKKRADEDQRKETFSPKSKKIAIAGAALGILGAASVAYMMSRRGGVKVSQVTSAPSMGFGYGRSPWSTPIDERMAAQGFGPIRATGQQSVRAIFSKPPVKVASLPDPNVMVAEARMAAVRNRVFLTGNRSLTEKTWRDSAKLSRMKRKIGPTGKHPSIEQIRKYLDDPNHVWTL